MHREVDVTVIGGGPGGYGSFPITRKIQEAYLNAIHGKTAKYESWLSYASLPPIYNRPASEKAS